MSTTDLPAGRAHVPVPTAPPVDAVATLRGRVIGRVLVPGDAAYDQRRLAWNRSRSHEPAVIVVAGDVADVVAAVRFAAEHDLGLGVQATGHGMVLPVDGVLLDTSELTEVVVRVDRRTAWVSAGCTWGPVLAAAQQHGLAPLLGSSSGVGAVGYTLGGGLGWLARKHGAACDAVRAFEVVTPAGELVRAREHEHPDLFRALRGGAGGAFGVVTGMEIELVPVTTVYAGDLLYPAEAAVDVLDAWREWVADVPDELTSAVVLMNFPPLPDVPEEIRGRSFTIVRGCWSGDLAEGRRVLDEWRGRMPPAVDLWDDLPFAQADAISKDPVDPMPAVAGGRWLDQVDRGIAEDLATATFEVDGPPHLVFSEIRHVGGAVARGDREHAALGHRDRQFLFHAVGAPAAHDLDAVAAHLAALEQRLQARTGGGAYLNFVEHEARRDRAADAVDERHRDALADLQRRLDPNRVLRFGVDHAGTR